MKKMTLLAAIVLAFAACKKDNDSKGLTPCLETEIELFKISEEAVAVLTMVNNSESVYWFKLSHDAHTADGCDYVKNSACETVCNFGGKCLPIEINCPDRSSPNWEIIWEK